MGPDTCTRAGTGRLAYVVFLPAFAIILVMAATILVSHLAGVLTAHLAVQIVLAGAVTAVPATIGAAVLAAFWHFMPEFLLPGALACMFVRSLATAISVVFVIVIMTQTGKAFLVSTAAFYLTGLTAETVLVVIMHVTLGPQRTNR